MDSTGCQIYLSTRALEKIKEQLVARKTPDAALRLGLRSGGCSGYSYVIQFEDDPPSDRDHQFEFDGVKVFVDKKSMIYLAGITLDWEKSLSCQGFKIINEKEKTKCGCGLSFSV